jgi:hypothetical protein
MLLLVRAFFPPSAGETSEKEQEERPSSNLLPQAGEGKKLKSAPMRLCGNDAWAFAGMTARVVNYPTTTFSYPARAFALLPEKCRCGIRMSLLDNWDGASATGLKVLPSSVESTMGKSAAPDRPEP